MGTFTRRKTAKIKQTAFNAAIMTLDANLEKKSVISCNDPAREDKNSE